MAGVFGFDGLPEGELELFGGRLNFMAADFLWPYCVVRTPQCGLLMDRDRDPRSASSSIAARMKTPTTFISLLVTLALFSCTATSDVSRLATFDAAADQVGVTDPKVFGIGEISPHTFPAVVPIAEIRVTSDAQNRRAVIREVYRKASDLGADVALIMDSQTYVTGEDTRADDPFGLAFPTYERKSWVLACRLAPSRLGVQTNSNGMVTVISNPSVRDAGVQEGDTLLSIAGIKINPETRSASLDKWLIEAQVGSEVPLVWIRPGPGRMEGVALMVENPPTHLQLEDLVSRSNQELQERLGSKLKGF